MWGLFLTTMKTLKLQVLDLFSADDTLQAQELRDPPTSESEGAFDGYYDLDKDEVDDEDEAEELPAKTSVPSRSSTKQRTQVTGGLRKRDAALKSEVHSLFISFFV